LRLTDSRPHSVSKKSPPSYTRWLTPPQSARSSGTDNTKQPNSLPQPRDLPLLPSRNSRQSGQRALRSEMSLEASQVDSSSQQSFVSLSALIRPSYDTRMPAITSAAILVWLRVEGRRKTPPLCDEQNLGVLCYHFHKPLRPTDSTATNCQSVGRIDLY